MTIVALIYGDPIQTRSEFMNRAKGISTKYPLTNRKIE